MYVFGGFDGQERLNDMWRINLAMAASPPEQHGGGDDGSGRRGPVWEEVLQSGTLPPSCCHTQPVVADNTMYVFSGHSGKETSNRLFALDLSDHRWGVFDPCHPLNGGGLPPARRFGHSMVLHRNETESAL